MIPEMKSLSFLAAADRALKEDAPASRTLAAAGLVLVLLVSIYGLVLIRTAWLGDDAYIMFRTVDHFVHGRGLVWNLGERVQAYTPPLWLFLTSAVYAVTGEIYGSSLALGWVISIATVVVFAWRTAKGKSAAILGLVILLLSRCFIEYSTSGLENPLTHLLLAVFVWLAVEQDGSPRRVFELSLAASLLVLNRLDIGLLIAPVCLMASLRIRRRAAATALIAGLAPFLLWECFSLFYYGFPFPNTAYAKLRTGIGEVQLLKQGVFYGLNFIEHDVISAAVIMTALVAPLITRTWRYVPFSAGLFMHGVYTLYIGGDFMSGRFFSAPLFFAVCVLAQSVFPYLRMYEVLLAGGLCVLGGLCVPHPPILTDGSYGVNRQDIVNGSNIADERAYYYPSMGLLRRTKYNTEPDMANVQVGVGYAVSATPLAISGNTGLIGFYAGPNVYILDFHALSDPLLARLPVQSSYNFVIGHYYRPIPPGYEETLRTGKNTLEDPNLAKYWEKLAVVTRGPLLQPARLLEVLKFNVGAYDHLLRAYSDAREVNWKDLPRWVSDGTLWNTPGVVKMPYTGAYIRLGGLQHKAFVAVSLNGLKDWQLFYFCGNRLVARQFLSAKPDANPDFMTTYIAEVPPGARMQGYNRIGIMPPLPLGTKQRFGVGHLTLGSLEYVRGAQHQ